MAHMVITAVFEVPDDQRAQGRIIGQLDEPMTTWEAAIKAAGVKDVEMHLRVLRKLTKPRGLRAVEQAAE